MSKALSDPLNFTNISENVDSVCGKPIAVSERQLTTTATCSKSMDIDFLDDIVFTCSRGR